MNVRLASLSLLFAVAACGDTGSSGDTGGTLILTSPAAWTPGPPPIVADQLGRVITDQIYDRLADIGDDMNTIGDAGFTPVLARSWTWAADSLSIAFHLDPDARWHDGQPVRASDVRFSFMLSKDPKTGSIIAPLLGNVDSMTVRDSLTAVAWFKRRSPEQFYDLVYQVLIMPRHVWSSVPRDRLATSDAAKAPIGSGRFRFAKFEPGVRIELVADTANYRGRARLDRVIYSIVPDGGAALTQLFTGQADMLELLPPDAVAKVDSTPTLRARKFDGPLFSYLAFNSRDPKRLTAPHPILGDRTVRRALSMALDRAGMLKNVFDTLGSIGVGPFPRSLADTTVTLLPYDPARAAALLDSAGWKVGANGVRSRNGVPMSLSLIMPSSSRVRMRYGVLIQEQLKNIGVDVKLETMEFLPFNDRQNARRFDMTIQATGYDPSPSSLKQVWTTSAIGGQNIMSYSNPAFDAAIDSALASWNPAQSRAIAHRAYQTLIDDAPAVWLYDILTIAGIHKRVQTPRLRANGWWTNLADWWIPANERIDRDRVGLRVATP